MGDEGTNHETDSNKNFHQRAGTTKDPFWKTGVGPNLVC